MSGRSFEERSTNLTNGITDPVLGLIRLTKRTSASRRGTVLDDGVRDTLFGSGSDWFFSFAKDRVLRRMQPKAGAPARIVHGRQTWDRHLACLS